jgi:hypothetical protein
MENKLETPSSAVFKRFAKRLGAYNPSTHDLFVLLFRIATNEGGYTESDLQYMIDKIFGDKDVDADWDGNFNEPPDDAIPAQSEVCCSCEKTPTNKDDMITNVGGNPKVSMCKDCWT